MQNLMQAALTRPSGRMRRRNSVISVGRDLRRIAPHEVKLDTVDEINEFVVCSSFSLRSVRSTGADHATASRR